MDLGQPRSATCRGLGCPRVRESIDEQAELDIAGSLTSAWVYAWPRAAFLEEKDSGKNDC